MGGRLTERTTESGLSQWLGWWNGIAGGDVDNDGDIDYVVTNFGLNTKYHASVEKPALLYYRDYAGRGEMHLMEAEFENDVLYPIRGKSCTTSAIPAMAGRFSTYRDFALVSLEEIYTREVLEAAFRFEANTLESAILLNDGSGNFSLRALPRLAQASPTFGAALADLDVYLVQNLFTPQQETGRFDGDLSLLLSGRG